MLVSRRHEEAPALDASSIAVDLRSARLRISVHRTRNATTDYGLVSRASPFLDCVQSTGRASLTLVLEGHGRFDERGRRGWLDPGDFVLSDVGERGTEAYGGPDSAWIVVEWRTDVAQGPFRIESISRRDLLRARMLARAFQLEPTPQHAIALLDLLRSAGVPIEHVTAAALVSDEPEQRLGEVVYAALSRLRRLPDVEDLARELGCTARTVHRRVERLASRYALPWLHWRAALRHARMVQAIRWLSAEGATTEAVARLTGFRSPAALCHAFDEAGLPSPGMLARAARRGALVEWAQACPEESIDTARDRPLSSRA